MKQVFNVVRPREYSGRNGTRTAWDRVGVLIQEGERISIRLDSVPVGEWDGWLKAFPKDEAATQAQAQPAPAAQTDEFNDEVPF